MSKQHDQSTDEIVVRNGVARPRQRARRKHSGRGFNRFPKGGPNAHTYAVKKARDIERLAKRRADAWRLFVDKAMTFDEIGKVLDISGKTAWEDVVKVRQALIERGLLDEDLIRARQQASLDILRAKHIAKAGKKDSAEILLRTLEREARLNGIDRQRTIGYSADQVMALLRTMTELFLETVSDLEARRRFIAGIRQKIAPALAQALPASPNLPAPPSEPATGTED